MIAYPEYITLLMDTGFQGYELEYIKRFNRKKPRKKELTEKEKANNRKISMVRVRVEHAVASIKRSQCVKDVLRKTKDGFSDLVMVIPCSLHNL